MKYIYLLFAGLGILGLWGLSAYAFYSVAEPLENHGVEISNTDKKEEIKVKTETLEEMVVEPEPVKRLMIRAPYSYYAFPEVIRTTYDTQGNLSAGQMIVEGGVSLRARDLWVLQKINEIIDSEVDPDAAAFSWPGNLYLSTDSDRVATYSKWICSGALMTERDDYLLDALTDIRRGRNPQTEGVWFNGALTSKYDTASSYADSQCFSDGPTFGFKGTPMESRDRFLRDVINSIEIQVEIAK